MSKTFSYKHKEIPQLISTNHYLERNAASFDRLMDIYDGNIEYTPDDYPVLINCMERLYKGVYQELREMFPETYKLTDADIKIGHHFKAIAMKINNKIPISNSYEGYMVVLDGLQKIESQYNDARFTIEHTLEDFRSTFRRYELQTNRLYVGLNKFAEKLREEKEDVEITDW